MTLLRTIDLPSPPQVPMEQVLGIPFFVGDAATAAEAILTRGGLLVAPSGPNLADMPDEPAYARAVCESNLAVADSGLMILLWKLLHPCSRLPRLSGLAFLRALLDSPRFKTTKTLVVAARDSEAESARTYFKSRSLPVPFLYTAPLYPRNHVEDPELLSLIAREKPGCVIICIGGGVQEVLGHWLCSRLPEPPAIICTGAALAFLTGDQATISPLADRLYLGWLLRCIQNPSRFIPRYLRAIRLVPVLLRWRGKAPEARSSL